MNIHWYEYKIKEIGAFFSCDESSWDLLSWQRPYRIHSCVLFIRLYVTPLVLITWSFYLLTTFTQFSSSHAWLLVTTNLTFFQWICLFVFEVQLTYNALLETATHNSDFSIHFKVITTNVVTICHCKKIRHSYWLYSSQCILNICNSVILQLEDFPAHLPHLCLSSP